MHSDVIGRFFIMKYIHIIIFLLTHDLTELKEYWEVEFIKKEFKWSRLLNKLSKSNNTYMMWYRLAYFMFRSESNKQKRVAVKINRKLNIRYSIDIPLQAEIGIGFDMWHPIGVVITRKAKIGDRLKIGSNVVIGFKNYDIGGSIKIGDDVTIGASSMIFGQNIKIGDNVKIGAMSFINKDIPDNCTVYTKKTTILKKF